MRPAQHRYFCIEPCEPRRLLSVTPVVIDLLALYTPQAAGNHGGGDALQSLIRSSVDSMNQALLNSEIAVTVRVVHVEQINYIGADDLGVDRQRLVDPSDGHMDSAHALRDQHGADLVMLISDGPNVAGGVATLLDDLDAPDNDTRAFSVVAENSIGPSNLTIAHEIGHNLGGGHERGNTIDPAVGPFPYSYGHRFTANGVVYHDIMSYDPGIVVAYFANPNVSVFGTPTGSPEGQPDSADLASTFEQTAPLVAAYRPTVVADTTAPTASLVEIDRDGTSLTFVVRYADDSGIQLSTIDSSDVRVSGPGGFVRPASLVSIEKPGVGGAFREATYHVLLPATSPPTESLTFSLAANQVSDIHGQFIPAGPIARNAGYVAEINYARARDLGALELGSTRSVFNEINALNETHFYRFELSSAATVSAALKDLGGEVNIAIARDSNSDGEFTFDEELKFGVEPGTSDEGIAVNVPAGTYYVRVSGLATAAYTLELRAAVDTTAPTATLDAVDLKTAGAPHVDFAVTYSDDFDLDGITTRFSSAVDITVQLDGGGSFGFFLFPDFTLNNSAANAPSKTIFYRLSAFNPETGYTAAENGTYTIGIHQNSPGDPRVHDAAGNDIPILSLGSFRIAIGTPDAQVPTATLVAAPPVPGQAAWEFDVAYHDNVGLDVSTLDNNDIRVTGPGFDQLATLVSTGNASAMGSTRVARYRVTAPGGFWDSSDDGTYTVLLEPAQVRDTTGNAAAGAILGSAVASSPLISASGGIVTFHGTAWADVIRFDADSNFVYFTLEGSGLWTVPATLLAQLQVDSGDGNDLIEIISGSFSGTFDLGGGADTLRVGGDAVFTFSSNQQVETLEITGTAALAPHGTRVLTVGELSITGAGALDLNDNGLVVDYTSDSPHDQVRALLVSGYASGAWTGGGIRSTSAAAAASTALGFAEASQVFSVFPVSFLGQSVDPTSVLVLYTCQGDANLDRTVNVADLGALASNWQLSPRDWVAGDFNFDQIVDVADLGALASNWQQSLPAAAPAQPAISARKPARPADRPVLDSIGLRDAASSGRLISVI